MRWLLITQKLDRDDDQLGFMLRWVEELARRLDQLDVIAQSVGAAALPGNVRVYSLGKEVGRGRLGQARRLTDRLRRLTPQADGVLCHMIPRYVLFAAPWTRLHRKPLLLWYTHRAASAELRLAHRLATGVLTAAPGSFPLASDKVQVMGHGVDADLFAPAAEAAPPTVIQVARLARIKRQDWLLRAAALLRARGEVGEFRVQLVGGPVPGEPEYAAELADLADVLGLGGVVDFAGPLAPSAMAAALQSSAVAVNLSPPGLFDKAALEAMAAARPTLVTNRDFLPLLGEAADRLYLPHDASDADLAARLADLLALTPSARAELGATLRARALAAHGLDALMDRIVAVLAEAARS